MPKMTEFEIKQLDLLGQINDKLGNLLASGGLKSVSEGSGTWAAAGVKVIEIDGMQAPWMIEGFQWEGKNEIDDEDELTEFLGINPNDDDPDGLPWCGAWSGKVMQKMGINTIDSLRAVDYIAVGTECGCVDGALAVFDGGHVGGGHVGFVCDNGTKILGGNQGDSVRKNNLAWYLQNKTLLGYRCPDGYKLV